jgi:O-antigen ligase
MTSPIPAAVLIEPSAVSASSVGFSQRYVLYGTLGLLLFGPLAFGGTDPWSILVLQSGSALLFAMWAVGQLRSGTLCIRVSRLFFPMTAFALLVAIQILGARTASREKTFSMAMLFVCYALLSFLIVQSLRCASQVRKMAWVVCCYGSAVAIFALVQGLTAEGKIYWHFTPHFGGWTYGSYVNHNHYAGLMEMLTPIALVAFLSPYISTRNRWLAGAAAALMGGSILLSGSRGGMISLALELLLLVFILLWQRAARNVIVGVAAIVCVIVGLFLWIGDSQLTERLSSIRSATTSEISSGTRLALDRDGLRMFAQRPALGWGLGTFPVVYPQFRSFYTDLYVDHAHNDYIQLLVETGALGFVSTLWFLAIALSGAVKKIRHYSFHTSGLVGLACLLGITGILAHSFVDFNLEIPANAALFFSLCTVAAAETKFGLHHVRSRIT